MTLVGQGAARPVPTGGTASQARRVAALLWLALVCWLLVLVWPFPAGLGGCAARTVVLIVVFSSGLGFLAGWVGASRRGVGPKGWRLVSRSVVCSFPVELPWARLPPALSLHVGLIVVGPLTSLRRSGRLLSWPACKAQGFALAPHVVRPGG